MGLRRGGPARRGHRDRHTRRASLAYDRLSVEPGEAWWMTGKPQDHRCLLHDIAARCLQQRGHSHEWERVDGSPDPIAVDGAARSGARCACTRYDDDIDLLKPPVRWFTEYWEEEDVLHFFEATMTRAGSSGK